MSFLIFAYVLLAFIVVVVVLNKHGQTRDIKRKRIIMVEGKQKRTFAMELEESFYTRFFEQRINKIKEALKKSFTVKKKQKNKAAKDETIQRKLRLAGLSFDVQEFSFIKLAFMSFCIVFTLFFVLIMDIDPLLKLLIVLVGVMLGVSGPVFILGFLVSSRQAQIKTQLADTFDLLSVCIEAGLSFDASLLRVAEKMKGPFIDELMIVYREIQMGRVRKEALQDLGNSSDIQELKTFASALVQADQLGIPINNVMNVQSKQLRNARREEAREKGMKASIKMMIPMLLFIFPVVFIIIMGPTVLNLVDVFSS